MITYTAKVTFEVNYTLTDEEFRDAGLEASEAGNGSLHSTLREHLNQALVDAAAGSRFSVGIAGSSLESLFLHSPSYPRNFRYLGRED